MSGDMSVESALLIVEKEGRFYQQHVKQAREAGATIEQIRHAWHAGYMGAIRETLLALRDQPIEVKQIEVAQTQADIIVAAVKAAINKVSMPQGDRDEFTRVFLDKLGRGGTGPLAGETP